MVALTLRFHRDLSQPSSLPFQSTWSGSAPPSRASTSSATRTSSRSSATPRTSRGSRSTSRRCSPASPHSPSAARRARDARYLNDVRILFGFWIPLPPFHCHLHIHAIYQYYRVTRMVMEWFLLTPILKLRFSTRGLYCDRTDVNKTFSTTIRVTLCWFSNNPRPTKCERHK